MFNGVKVFHDFLSKEECNFILEKCKKELTLNRADVYTERINKKSIRESSVAWIDDLDLVNERLKKTLKETFNINGISVTDLGQFQFTEYGVGDYFDWHVDNNSTVYKNRFASSVIQLNDDYTNGVLEIKNTEGKIMTIDNKIGTLYIFNSNLSHRVTPVESGIRYSLVNWVSIIKTNPNKQNII